MTSKVKPESRLMVPTRPAGGVKYKVEPDGAYTKKKLSPQVSKEVEPIISQTGKWSDICRKAST